MKLTIAIWITGQYDELTTRIEPTTKTPEEHLSAILAMDATPPTRYEIWDIRYGDYVLDRVREVETRPTVLP